MVTSELEVIKNKAVQHGACNLSLKLRDSGHVWTLIPNGRPRQEVKITD